MEKFFDFLWKNPTGRIIILNIVDSIRCGCLEISTAREYLKNWKTVCQPLDGSLTVTDITAKMRACREADIKFHICSKKSPDLRPVDRIVSVMPWKRVFSRLSRSSRTLLKPVKDLTDDFDLCSSDSERDSIENKIFVEMNAVAGGNQFVTAELVGSENIKPGGEKNIIWFTTMDKRYPEYEIFYPPIGSKFGKCDMARDILGLIHIGYDFNGVSSHSYELYAAIAIRPKFISTVKPLARPTFIDADQHTRFRSVFGDLRKKPGNWGRAINLSHLKDDLDSIGGRELVAENFRPSEVDVIY